MFALWDDADQWHKVAEAAYLDAKRARREFCTTTFVMLECGNAASRRPYRDKVVQTMRQLAKDTALHVPTEQDWQDAWSAYERSRPGDASIVDCVSFIIMRRLGLTDAFTNDQHFKTAGFHPLF